MLSCDNQVLELASTKGHVDVVRLLLQDPRVDPTYPENACLKLSVTYNRPDVVYLLLQDSMIDPNIQNSYVVQWVIKSNQE